MADGRLYFGLGGVLREHVITASDIVSAWALNGLTGMACRDIAHDRNPGQYVWSGGGFAFGVPLALPGGGVGTYFNGGYIEVPDDGEGYKLAGDSGPRNLSGYGGDIDMVGLIQTTLNTPTRACLIGKQEAGREGWHVGLVNGRLVFYLRNHSEVQVFDMVGNRMIADGAWHLWHCTFDSVNGLAQILIDDQQVSWQSTLAVEPQRTVATLRIGRFNDGTGQLMQTSLAYLAMHRAGDPTLSTRLQAARTWTDMSYALRSESMDWHGGMTGTTVQDKQAGIGTYGFVMDNGAHVPPGTFAIGHPNCLPGFTIGMPVAFNLQLLGQEHNGFLGRLIAADPEAGASGGMRTHCLAGDWFAATAKATVSQVPIALNVPSQGAWASLVEHAEYEPYGYYINTGSEVFPFFGDVVDGPLLGEMAKVTVSEGSYSYLTRTGFAVFEARPQRQAASPLTPAISIDKTMRELTVEASEERLINMVSAEITPRRYGPHAEMVLYKQDRRTQIAPLATVIFDVSYQDPDQSRSRIGGMQIQPFTPNTDYTFTGAEDGTGNDWTADVEASVSLGGSGGKLFVTNRSETHDGWFAFQVRGRALYTDTPVTERHEDRDSIRRHGPMELAETYPYLNTLSTARQQAQATIALFAHPTPTPTSVVIRPRPDTQFEFDVALRNVGDLVALGETMTGLADLYWLQAIKVTFMRPNILEVEWSLFPSTLAQPFGVWDGATTWDGCAWGF